MSEDAGYFTRGNRGTAADGAALRTAYIGTEEGLTYIAPFVEDLLLSGQQPGQRQAVGTDEAAALWRATDADLSMLVVPAAMATALAMPGDIRAVARIHQVVDTSQGLAHVHAAMSSRERKRAAQAAADGYSYDISHDDAHFHTFYRTMHAPTMNVRYGDRARSVEEGKALETLFHAGALFRIFKSGEWVAGSVGQIDAARRTLNSRLIGVLAGDDRFRLEGAQNYVYHAILDWAAGEASIDRVDFQGCEPFLTKGTFQYKKRFGTSAEIPDNRLGGLRLLIRARLERPAVREFLINNPVLVQNAAGELMANYFFDGRTPPRKDIPFASPGIVGAVFRDLDAVTAAAVGMAGVAYL
jgi:hypothetical protein